MLRGVFRGRVPALNCLFSAPTKPHLPSHCSYSAPLFPSPLASPSSPHSLPHLLAPTQLLVPFPFSMCWMSLLSLLSPISLASDPCMFFHPWAFGQGLSSIASAGEETKEQTSSCFTLHSRAPSSITQPDACKKALLSPDSLRRQNACAPPSQLPFFPKFHSLKLPRYFFDLLFWFFWFVWLGFFYWICTIYVFKKQPKEADLPYPT